MNKFNSLLNGILGKIFIALSGGVLAQVIIFISTPFITRIYTPDVFGVMSNISQMATFLTPLLTLSLTYSFVLYRNLKNSRIAAINSLLLNFTISSVIIVILLLVAIFYDNKYYIGTLIFSVILAFTLATQEIYLFYALKRQWFLFRSKLLITQAILITVFKISFGIYSSSIYSLFIATLLSNTISNIYAYYTYDLNYKDFSLKKLYIGIKRNKTLVFFRTPQNLISKFSLLIPVSFLTFFFSPHDAGLYTLARTALFMPMNVIGTSISDVLYPQFTRLFNDKKRISPLLNKFVLILSALSIIPVAIIYLYGRELFSFVFGAQWGLASEYAQYMLVFLIFNFINKPYISLIPIFRMEKTFLNNSCLNCALNLIGLMIGYYIYRSPLYSIAFSSTLSVVGQLIIMFVANRNVQQYEKK